MQIAKCLAAVALLCGVSAVSYYVGYHNNDTKNYEAACLQADFIHSLMDYPKDVQLTSSEIEESYYEWFQDLEYGVYETKHLTLKDLENYYWCY